MISPSRLLLLSVLFYLISLGLGYPTLHRVDLEKDAGLSDVQMYVATETGGEPPVINSHLRFRLLVPYLARPFYLMARGRIGTWDPATFGLLIVNAFFTAATAIILLVLVFRVLGSYAIALGSALIYLLNFAVPNLRLVGLIDAGEGFFLLLVVWSLFAEKYWILPFCGVLGAAAKESFAPFVVVFTLSWWLYSRKTMRNRWSTAAWMVSSWIAALASVALAQWKVRGTFESPARFGMEMHQNTAYFHHFLSTLMRDHDLWYTFCWLLPLGLINLKRFPRKWVVATTMTGLTVFALDSYFGADPGSVSRALFSVAGPLLSASVAVLVFTTPTVSSTQQKSIFD